jgi:hypothetical protein
MELENTLPLILIKEPVIRAMTFRGTSKMAREMGIDKPVFMREPVPWAKHVHQ